MRERPNSGESKDCCDLFFQSLFYLFFFRCIITTDSVDPSLFPLACVGFI